MDPIAGNTRNPQSWNRYSYVLGNPVNWVDPLGLAVAVICESTWDSIGNTIVHCWDFDLGDPRDQANSRGGHDHGLGRISLIPGYRLPQAPQQSYWGCVAERADSLSAREVLGAGNSFLADAFLGNTFADGINLVRTLTGAPGAPGPSDALRSIGGEAVSHATGWAGGKIAASIPNLVATHVTMDFQATITATSASYRLAINASSLSLPFGTAARSAADFASGVGMLKNGYDLLAASAAAGSCLGSR